MQNICGTISEYSHIAILYIGTIINKIYNIYITKYIGNEDIFSMQNV